VVDSRGIIALGLALLLAGFAACNSSSSTPSNPTPVDTGVLLLVPPAGCTPAACQGATIDNLIITGPMAFTPFTLSFTVASRFPFLPPGGYKLIDGSFTNSAGATTGCPPVSFTVATAKTTTVTFSITNDVCNVKVGSPT
jgi:hypothetical protein